MPFAYLDVLFTKCLGILPVIIGGVGMGGFEILILAPVFIGWRT